ncbi:hypothetical protein QQS45_13510 [Alteriqipengyuania flavescens]|uniref:DUF6683 family protein n=1 Tax=Alteriqipengyuania flavescens TaxID=3053610 RepID=UPI0025B48204|nr:DUF6683 family protein [Alteriqipengyuania flavescens]WJY18606.1 hypothetical protein QQW98_13505 [Alteriqipengyuania flavescens]WJY24546.1 hypothetical protein QQS45_13510 [Alteriqipengyuania flavescens]
MPSVPWQFAKALASTDRLVQSVATQTFSRHPMCLPRYLVFAVTLVAPAIFVSPAAAQDIGGGFISAGIGNAGIEAATIALEDQVSEPGHRTVDAQARTEFNFVPTESQRRRTASRVARNLVPAPQRDEFAAQFDDDFYAMIDGELSYYGLSTNNLADTYAFWWLIVWDAAHGVSTDTTPAQAQGVRDQVAAALVESFPEMSDSDRQAISDEFVIHAVLFMNELEASAGDPARLANIKSSARSAAISVTGMDPLNLRVTDEGFRPID